MNLFVKLMAFFLVLALAAPFFLKGPDGGPLISFQDVQATDGGLGTGIDKAESLISKVVEPVQAILDKQQSNHQNPDPMDAAAMASSMNAGAETLQFYRWQDENGNWHFTDQKDLHADSQLVNIENDATIVKMDSKELLNKLEKIYNTNPLDGQSEKNNALNFPGLMSGTLSLKEMLSVFDKAKEVQGVLDARYEGQTQAVDGL